jgi:hypothetical protein
MPLGSAFSDTTFFDLRQILGVTGELVMSRYTRVGIASEAQTVIKT